MSENPEGTFELLKTWKQALWFEIFLLSRNTSLTLSDIYYLPTNIRKKFIEYTIEDIKRMNASFGGTSETPQKQQSPEEVNQNINEYMKRKGIINDILNKKT